jgi:hypothetical protein
MNNRLLFLCLVGASALAGAGPTVPAELMGRWASTPSACGGKDASVIVISGTDVELGDIHGHVVAGATPGNRAIEVHFRSPAGGATARNVRTYRLAADSGTLLELSGNRLVATRVRCGA